QPRSALVCSLISDLRAGRYRARAENDANEIETRLPLIAWTPQYLLRYSGPPSPLKNRPRLHRWNSAGVTPVKRRNAVVKWLCPQKPVDKLMSARVVRIGRSIAFARSTRRSRTYRCGVTPIAILNMRAKW